VWCVPVRVHARFVFRGSPRGGGISPGQDMDGGVRAASQKKKKDPGKGKDGSLRGQEREERQHDKRRTVRKKKRTPMTPHRPIATAI
jgi:hypothetical protein